jgi:hypothetical protein
MKVVVTSLVVSQDCLASKGIALADQQIDIYLSVVENSRTLGAWHQQRG